MASKIKKAGHALTPYRARVELSPGDAVRLTRELQEMTQIDLAAASGIPQGTISALERGRVTLGAERAEKLARALKVHPAVLLWPKPKLNRGGPDDHALDRDASRVNP